MEASGSSALRDAFESGALSPEGGTKRLSFPSLGHDAIVHPLSLARMEKDERAVGSLVGVLFKLGELAAPTVSGDDKTVSHEQYWAIILGLLPQQLVNLLGVVAACVIWEKRKDCPASKPEPDIRTLSHFVLPLFVTAWVEVSFPSPLALAGWVASLTRVMDQLSPEEADPAVETLIFSLRARSELSEPEPSQSDEQSERPPTNETGSETE